MEATTQAAFARRHGVSRKTVTVWKQQGRLVLVGSLVDVAASDARLQGSGHGRFHRSAAPIPRQIGAGGVFDRAACEAHLAATYGGNPETLKTGRTRGRGPRSLPWGIIYRTMGRTERIFPLRLILEISK